MKCCKGTEPYTELKNGAEVLTKDFIVIMDL